MARDGSSGGSNGGAEALNYSSIDVPKAEPSSKSQLRSIDEQRRLIRGFIERNYENKYTSSGLVETSDMLNYPEMLPNRLRRDESGSFGKA